MRSQICFTFTELYLDINLERSKIKFLYCMVRFGVNFVSNNKYKENLHTNFMPVYAEPCAWQISISLWLIGSNWAYGHL